MVKLTQDEKNVLIGMVNDQLNGHRRAEEHFGLLSRINRGEDRKRYKEFQKRSLEKVLSTELLLDKIKHLEVE